MAMRDNKVLIPVAFLAVVAILIRGFAVRKATTQTTERTMRGVSLSHKYTLTVPNHPTARTVAAPVDISPTAAQVLTALAEPSPISDADDATTRAVREANRVAQRDYSVAPFRGRIPQAVFDGR